jgi:hypothetical protein
VSRPDIAMTVTAFLLMAAITAYGLNWLISGLAM